MRIGLYPGTFDPITRGHLDIIKRACVLVDKLVIGVAINRDKNPFFSLEERVEMIERNLSKFEHNETNIIVEPFENLLIDKASEVGAQIVIRGLRAVSDFEYEFQLAGMNKKLNSKIETMFLMSDVENQIISSKFVKEIAKLNGKIDNFVTKRTKKALMDKYD